MVEVRDARLGEEGNSYYDGRFVSHLAPRLLGFLFFPAVPAGAFAAIIAIGGYRALLAAVITGAALCFVCGPAAAAVRILLTVNHTVVDGAPLEYTGRFAGTALFLIKLSLFSLATLGLYWLSGLSAAAVNRYVYERTSRKGGAPGRSGFVGNFVHIILPRVIIVAVPLILLYMSGLLPLRPQNGERFLDYLAKHPDQEPSMHLWTLMRYVVYMGSDALRSGTFYNEVTTLIWSGIMLFIAALVLLPWYRGRMLKWQIDNTVIDGYRLTYSAVHNDYFLLVFLNGFLSVVTLGLFNILGLSRLSMMKFRAKHTHVYVPVSGQASQTSYMIPPEALRVTWRGHMRAVFSPEARLRTKNYARRYWTLYLLLIVPMVYLIVFKYIPMLYIQMGFKTNNIMLPVWDNPWSSNYGFEWFIKAFKNKDFINALRNTLVLNGLDLLFGFPAPIILALLLNELSFRKYKRISQTIFYMPHFLSWVIIAALALKLFSSTGLVNLMLENAGRTPLAPFSDNAQWVVMYVLLGIWQSAGWGTIIYLAAITNINPELYEAAEVDGAGRLRKIWNITLPGLRPTIIVLLIMRMGSILGSDFERPFALKNPLVSPVADVISIYVYTHGIRGTQFALSSAVGIFQSAICLIFLFGANSLAKKFGERGIW
ncbi:MAG: DUF898 family protein [Oscillospiraceae bacterium]|jgi:putative aldouronate transport system permease protein|nr:DUF898 family protein [Oscillospiraceae bacterium]